MLITLESAGNASRANTILSERARCHFWSGRGALSVKSFDGGRAFYDTGRGRYAVDGRSYLVLNEGREYTVEIDEPDPVESFCVFFASEIAGEAFRSVTVSHATLLDEPSAPSGPIEFHERTYPHDTMVTPVLSSLRTGLSERARERGWLEERLYALAAAMVRAQGLALTQASTLPFVRPATRLELYRRLHLARDYAEACYADPLGVDELARVACLSPGHFLRSFRALFGRSPHQYLTEVRLRHARHLVETRDHGRSGHGGLPRRRVREPGFVLDPLPAPVRRRADRPPEKEQFSRSVARAPRLTSGRLETTR
jgi:AraC family transcriptional regulator